MVQEAKNKILLTPGLDSRGKRRSHGPCLQGVYNLMGNASVRIQSEKQNHDKQYAIRDLVQGSDFVQLWELVKKSTAG